MKHVDVTAENGKEYTVDSEGTGPTSLTFKARSKAAAYLRELGFSVTVTVTGPGGAPIDEDSAAVITAAMTAASGVDPREAGAAAHMARAKARMESSSRPTGANLKEPASKKTAKPRAA